MSLRHYEKPAWLAYPANPACECGIWCLTAVMFWRAADRNTWPIDWPRYYSPVPA